MRSSIKDHQIHNLKPTCHNLFINKSSFKTFKDQHLFSFASQQLVPNATLGTQRGEGVAACALQLDGDGLHFVGASVALEMGPLQPGEGQGRRSFEV